MSDFEFVPGQRWISNAESDLGLGIVVDVASRRVELTFPAAAEQRVYAADNAPLGRVIYPIGDRVSNAEGQHITITDCHTQDGCVVYVGVDDRAEQVVLHEIDLDSFVHFSQPKDRLFAGQVDKPNRFRLRCETLRHQHRTRQSSVYGLLGPRVQLLPHQLYIASQVANRHAPRVLLADEVGLGKTIEAGLILHQQLVSGHASRVLVVVPDSLVHQWLVEMLRRFNLRFTILDEARCEAMEADEEDAFEEEFADIDEHEEDIEEENEDVDDQLLPPVVSGDNPFESAQLVLCSLSFLVDNPRRAAQAQSASWDLLVVDEAHHLHWSQSAVSPAYACIETLAQHISGLLLLTATPEQLGVEGHFARLRLLDSDRYYDIQKFLDEENSYTAVSDLVAALLESDVKADQAACIDLVEKVAHYLGEAAGQELQQALQGDAATLESVVAGLVQSLLDRHGTGRVLFRNTRDAVAGFPQRILHPYALPCSTRVDNGGNTDDLASLLQPEKNMGQEWLLSDPRVTWLVSWLAENRQDKALVICASSNTAKTLEEFLRLRQGVRSAVFHEGMSLIERDRAAAYFADEDDPAQVLICSEIGSEGRNFQFAQHLVLFDLPLNPDLLEQRIGRLDRIGQTRDVNIHVPFHKNSHKNSLGNSAQAVMLRWYHDGLNAFERVCPVGSSVYSQVGEQLHHCLTHSDSGVDSSGALDELIDTTHTLTTEMLADLQLGRDRLLEMNSCNVERAEAVIAELSAAGQGRELAEYLDAAFDEFGIEHHYHSTEAIVVEPGDHMLSHAVTGLPEGGLTATFSRTRALSREDMQFFTWEHPLVAGLMETIAESDFGSTTVCTLKLPPLRPGSILLEAVFTLRCLAPRTLQVQRYISQSLVRVLVDEKGLDLSATLSEEHLVTLCKPVKKNVVNEMVRHIRSQVDVLVNHAEALARPQQETIIAAAQQQARAVLGEETRRLEALAQVNPNIRSDEVTYLQDVMAALDDYLASAELRMDAMRVIVVTG
ncbi:MAG: RNA polymerase-associated protein RapA [Gammaproteobacteria bacterium]|nr:MAG: RNA polymerase-associated protein RapA [Gammaproteobacteria bacterium]